MTYFCIYLFLDILKTVKRIWKRMLNLRYINKYIIIVILLLLS